MLRSLNFGVGVRNGKHHAFWDSEDGRMEGPPRDTEKEALADRDRALQLAVMHIRAKMPEAVVSTSRIQ